MKNMGTVEQFRRIDASNAGAAPDGGKYKRVLIYDDDEFYAQECAEALQRQGFVTETRAGRTDFLPLVARFAPDLLLLDLHMPEFDGVEALRALRDYEAKQNLAVVLVSGSGDVMLSSAASISRAYGINLLGVLAKPLRLSELTAVMAGSRPVDKTSQI